LGSALKNFKKSVKDTESEESQADSKEQIEDKGSDSVIEGEATEKEKEKDKT
jgi:Sec-independent protein translocase protein TatA